MSQDPHYNNNPFNTASFTSAGMSDSSMNSSLSSPKDVADTNMTPMELSPEDIAAIGFDDNNASRVSSYISSIDSNFSPFEDITKL